MERTQFEPRQSSYDDPPTFAVVAVPVGYGSPAILMDGLSEARAAAVARRFDLLLAQCLADAAGEAAQFDGLARIAGELAKIRDLVAKVTRQVGE